MARKKRPDKTILDGQSQIKPQITNLYELNIALHNAVVPTGLLDDLAHRYNTYVEDHGSIYRLGMQMGATPFRAQSARLYRLNF
jgi:hypothetical protein